MIKHQPLKLGEEVNIVAHGKECDGYTGFIYRTPAGVSSMYEVNIWPQRHQPGRYSGIVYLHGGCLSPTHSRTAQSLAAGSPWPPPPIKIKNADPRAISVAVQSAEEYHASCVACVEMTQSAPDAGYTPHHEGRPLELD